MTSNNHVVSTSVNHVEVEDILEKLKIDTTNLPDLKPRQRAFLNYLFVGNSPTEAYRLAGYKIKHAENACYRLMKNDPVHTYIQLCKEKTRPIATFTDKIRRLWEIAESSHNGDTSIKAIAELNKMHGDYQPVQNMNINVNATATLEDIRNARQEYKRDK